MQPSQRSLFDSPAAEPISFDASFSALRRIELEPGSWLAVQDGWVRGADDLFEQILKGRKWGQRTRRMYEGRVLEPRLTAPWNLRSGAPLEPAILDEMRLALSRQYQVLFDSIGFNLYRDGRDSVAWHGDKIFKEIEEPVVALVSLGERRKFLLRPKGGGKSRSFLLGRGDLLVTFGKTQRTWEHSVPKVAAAGPRISLAFRYGMDSRAYGREKEAKPETP
ncbi:MAG: alpha-ketoglutarate-dependent dioxygenase AlkB [Myxococcales bacterium]